MANTGVYKQPPVHRLVDHKVPSINISNSLNPTLPFLRQLPELGWHNPCTPTRAGRKLNEFVDGQGKFNLLQDAAHLKRWVIEHVKTYIEGKLPVWIRAPKFALDVIKLIRYIQRIVATVLFYKSILNKETELANHYIGESIALIDFAESTLSPPSLRTEAEREVLLIWNQARQELGRQVNENNQARSCVI